MTPTRTALRNLAFAVAGAFALGACSNTLDRLAAVGEDPVMAPIENPVEAPQYQPVSLPMPMPDQTIHQPNSLWRPGARAFFKDQRASRVGDILFVGGPEHEHARVGQRFAFRLQLVT